MLTIRLTRVGKKNSPAYRVVVADKKRAVKRKFIEILGHYNPIAKPKEIVIDKDRASFWMERGAQPSDTIRNLMCDLGMLDKKEKAKKVYGKKFTKKQIKEGADKKEEVKTESTEAAEEKPAESEPEETTSEAETEVAGEESKESEAEVKPETEETAETDSTEENK